MGVFILLGALRGPSPNYIVGGAGADTRVSLGALLEVITAIANIGTAVALFPLLKRQNEGVALGYVAARVLAAGLRGSCRRRCGLARHCRLVASRDP
jgi:hypothetical protein